MISNALRLVVAVAILASLASWAIAQEPMPRLIAPEPKANEARNPAVEEDGKLLKMEQQIALEERRLSLEEKLLQIKQRWKMLEKMKKELGEQPHMHYDPYRPKVRPEQVQKITKIREELEMAAKAKAQKKKAKTRKSGASN